MGKFCDIISDEPLSPLARGNTARGDGTARSSCSSTEEKSAEDVLVDVGDKAGDCTMSCKKDGRSGAGA